MAAIRTILVHTDRSDPGRELLAQAAAFALSRKAHLIALMVGLEPPLPYMPLDTYSSDLEAVRESVRDATTWASERLAPTGASFEVRGIVAFADTVGAAVARHARYADLAIFPRRDADGDWHRLVDAALFESGRPVLLCPPGVSLEQIASRVVIGWDARPEAARAVGDALGLLSMSKDIRIVAVDPQVGPDGHGEEPGADLATWLSRHDLPITVDSIPRENLSVAEALLRHARGVDADLVVAGAYGHSRLGEIILGGTTRDLMETTERPLMMSH